MLHLPLPKRLLSLQVGFDESQPKLEHRRPFPLGGALTAEYSRDSVAVDYHHCLLSGPEAEFVSDQEISNGGLAEDCGRITKGLK